MRQSFLLRMILIFNKKIKCCAFLLKALSFLFLDFNYHDEI